MFCGHPGRKATSRLGNSRETPSSKDTGWLQPPPTRVTTEAQEPPGEKTPMVPPPPDAAPAHPCVPPEPLLTQAPVLSRSAAGRLLQVPGDSLHWGFSPKHGGRAGAFLLPQQRPTPGRASQGTRHRGRGLVLLERGLLLGTRGPGQGLLGVLTVDQRHLPPDGSQAVVLLLAGRGCSGGGWDPALRRGRVRALWGGRGAHVVELREDAFTGKVVKDVPRLDRVHVVQVLGGTFSRHLWGRGSRRGGLVGLSPVWPRFSSCCSLQPRRVLPARPRLLLGRGRWGSLLHWQLPLRGAGAGARPRPLLTGTRPPVLAGPVLRAGRPGLLPPPLTGAPPVSGPLAAPLPRTAGPPGPLQAAGGRAPPPLRPGPRPPLLPPPALAVLVRGASRAA